MDAHGSFVANLLDASPKAWSAGAVQRLLSTDSSVTADRSRRDLLLDAEHLVACFAEALAAGRPQLFGAEVAWARVAFRARSLPDDIPERTAIALREELLDRLPETTHEAIAATCSGALTHVASVPLEVSSLIEGEKGRSAASLLEGLLEGRRRDVFAMTRDLVRASGAPAFYADTLQPAMRELGRLWQLGEIEITEEHMVSRLVEGVVHEAEAAAPSNEGADEGPVALVTCVERDLHDLGTRIVSHHFALAGWRSLLLGANTPKDSLAASVRDLGARVVVLSAHLAVHVRSTADVIARLRESQTRVPVLVGGGPFELIDDLWEVVGADAGPRTASDAPDIARRLID